MIRNNAQGLKGRMYTTEGLPTADTVFNEWLANPSSDTATAAFMSIRAVFAVMNYINAVQETRQEIHQRRRDALIEFDDLYHRVCLFFCTGCFKFMR